MVYNGLKNFLFQFEPETSHYLTLQALQFAYRLGLTRSFAKNSQSPVKILGLTFPNRVGLAAGLDKNGDYLEALAALGFGFIEIGTVTPKPQVGNSKPRLFRSVKDEAVINRLGFNSKGLDYVVAKLKNKKFNGILGINLGKNRDTPLENAVNDYVTGFHHVAPYASYITINISSPNTEKLRDLQHGEFLQQLLRALKSAQASQKSYVPLLVKISPDLTRDELKEMAAIFLDEKIDGVIATNTTLSRDGILDSAFAKEAGGISGKPLQSLATSIIKQCRELMPTLPLIGVGGIMDAQSAQEKIAAGADLLQVYTGLIYHGPKLIQDVART